ncbi:MAG TPA: TPM domain-containing protein [Pirellulales bacterium]|nr:TPM domain-containing protein [Pirellulales bacterium]
MRGKALRLLLLLAAAVALFARPLPAYAQTTIADTGDFVIDKAEVIDAQTRSRLETWLEQLEQKTTAQVKILTVQSLGDEDVVAFSQRHYEAWKLGQKGKDNGALIVLSLEPHRIRIHTGYGLEGALPDSWCGTLSRDIAARFFKDGKFSAGLEQLTAAVVNKVADEYHVAVIGVPAVRHQPQGEFTWGGLACAIIFLVILVPSLLAAIAYFSNIQGQENWTRGRRRQTRWGSAWYDMFPSSGSSWTSGGGSFGGGFGGGGGSFGGGGSSGGGGGGASW